MFDWMPLWLAVLILIALIPVEIKRIRRARRDPVYSAERAQLTLEGPGSRARGLAVLSAGIGLYCLITGGSEFALVCFLFSALFSLLLLVLKRRAAEAHARALRR